MPTKTLKPNTDLISENGTGQSLIDRLREKSRLRTEVVHVERWDMDVTIRELSSREMRMIREAMDKEFPNGDPDRERVAIHAIAYSCVDPTFSVEDIDLLRGDDMADEPMRTLGNAVLTLNKMGVEGVKSAENSFPPTERQG